MAKKPTTAPTPRPPQQARARATLDKILTGTAALLDRHPLDDITMEGVAAEAGVSVGTLYTRFENREALLGYLLDHIQEKQIKALGPMLDDPAWEGKGLSERIHWLAQTMATAAKTHPGLLRAIFERLMKANPEERARLGEKNRRTVAALADWLLAAEDEIDRADGAAAARFAISFINHNIYLGLLYPEVFPGLAPEEIVALTADAAQRFLDGR